uniref:Uncharacterized protein n=1 Tax=Arundo donax TaxID=35708 RepID=A0A0A9C0L3_ARUDO
MPCKFFGTVPITKGVQHHIVTNLAAPYSSSVLMLPHVLSLMP